MSELLSIRIEGGKIITECLIDHTKLVEGVNYDVSGKLVTPFSLLSSYVPFNFKEDTLEEIIWEIPDGLNLRNVTVADWFGAVSSTTLTYEFDEGDGIFVSYASISLLANALANSTANLNRRVRITTPATSYIDGGIFLKYDQQEATGLTEIDLDVTFNKNDFSQRAVVTFEDKASFTTITCNESANYDIYYAVVSNNPDVSNNYTEFTLLNLTTLNNEIDALGAGNYAVIFALSAKSFFDSDTISNPIITVQGNFDSTDEKLMEHFAGDDNVNSGVKVTGNSLEFTYNGDNTNGQYCKRTSFATGTGEQLDINQDQSYHFILETYGETASGNFGDFIQLYSTQYFNAVNSASGGNFISIRNGIIRLLFRKTATTTAVSNNEVLVYDSSLKVPRNKKVQITVVYTGSNHLAGSPSNIDNIEFYIDGVKDPNPSMIFTGNFASGAISSTDELFIGCHSESDIAQPNAVNQWFQGKIHKILRANDVFTDLEVIEMVNKANWATGFVNKYNEWDFDQASGNVIDNINSKDLTPLGLGLAPAPSYISFY